MAGQYKEIGAIEFHPIKFERAEKEFIRALDVIGIDPYNRWSTEEKWSKEVMARG